MTSIYIIQNFYLKLFLIELKSIIVQHIIILSQNHLLNKNIFGIFTTERIAEGQRLSVFLLSNKNSLFESIHTLKISLEFLREND